MARKAIRPDKEGTKSLNVDLPDELFRNFDLICEELGLFKKRAAACAIAAFVKADRDQKLAWYGEVYTDWYASKGRDG